jgi:hypothetical protein
LPQLFEIVELGRMDSEAYGAHFVGYGVAVFSFLVQPLVRASGIDA